MYMMTSKNIVILVSCLLASGCIADNTQKESGTPNFFGIKLGLATLATVQEKYGEAILKKTGDASTSRMYICYRFTKNNINQVVLFGSSSEMAGNPNYELTEFELYQESDFPYHSSDCSNLNSSSKIDLYIDAEKSDVAVKLGVMADIPNIYKKTTCTKAAFPKDSSGYKAWKDRKDCFSGDEPYYDECTEVDALFKDNFLSKLIVRKIKSVC